MVTDHPRRTTMHCQLGQSLAGTSIALAIFSVWLASLVGLLTTPISTFPVPLVPIAVLGQTFLETGLFVIAHEAMHGLICPAHLPLNHAFGAIAAQVYALFPYPKLTYRHWQHHRHSECAQDPDFHDGCDAFVPWYLKFMREYWNWQQFLGLAVVVCSIGYVRHICPLNLLLFWALPLGLSSIQLFYFGTFLPHRGLGVSSYQPDYGLNQRLTWLISLLTCYHLGYHYEHHTYPQVPWWQLPQTARRD